VEARGLKKHEIPQYNLTEAISSSAAARAAGAAARYLALPRSPIHHRRSIGPTAWSDCHWGCTGWII